MSRNAPTDAEGSRPSPGTPAVAVLSGFRAALKAGQRPRIEDVLPNWAESDHSALLRGLVTLEVAYRLRHGERPTVEEYRTRFSGQDQAIEEALRHPTATPTPGRSGPRPAAATRMPAPEDEGAADRLPPLNPAAAPYALAAESAAGGQFGDYELREQITRDEVGVVYRAWQVSVLRFVALKLIMADGLASDANVQQFYRDTMAVAALDHPGIVPIFDVGQHEGQHFVSMGYIEGETLAKKGADGGLGLREGVDVVRQVAEMIAYAHGKGVVHRNLTPKNILLNARGRPKVTGFSSSAPLQSDGSQSLRGRVIGTPGYLAPEQAREGQDVGPAADIHALGAVLYFVLTGQPPFHGPNLVETLLKVLTRDPKPPRRLKPSAPPELEAICLKCLQKRPARRYAKASDLAEDLGLWLRNEKFDVPVESPVFRSARLVRQLCLGRPRLSITVAGIFAVIVGVAAFVLLPRSIPKVEQARADNIGIQRRDTIPGPNNAGDKGNEVDTVTEASVISRGKEATALVEVGAGGGIHIGSAFCFDASGLFVTAAHVVEPVVTAKTGTVRLVLHGGELGQKVVIAQVVRSDAELDLAVLKLEPGGDVPLVRLELGRDAGLVETSVITAIGYPLGTLVPHEPGRFPSVSVSVGRITALHKGAGGLSRIQLDAALNPGNSGGPVLDRQGKVIGVVAAGFRGPSGLNYAIPADQLTRFLRLPEVVFDPPPIRDTDLEKPVVWTIDVRPPTIGSLPPDVGIVVRLGRGAQLREAAVTRLKDGRFRAEVVPPGNGPVDLKVTVGGETLQGQTADREIKIGGETYALSRLSQLQRLDSGPKYRVFTAAGKELTQPVEGLGVVELDARGGIKPLDLSSASVIEVPLQDPRSIKATVEVKAGSSVLATARRELAFLHTEGPARDQGAAKLTASGDAKVVPVPPEVRLPGEIDDIALGGDRYLVIAVHNPPKLVIFDAATAAIAKELPLSGKALVAAGKKEFVVAYSAFDMIETYGFSSLTLKKEEPNLFPAKARVDAIAMGSDSEGPLLVLWSEEPPPHTTRMPRVSLINPTSLRVIRPASIYIDNPQPIYSPPPPRNGRWFAPGPANMPLWFQNIPPQVRASARGDLFTIRLEHTATFVAAWDSKASKAVYCGALPFGTQGTSLPGPDGRTIYSPGHTYSLGAGKLTEREGERRAGGMRTVDATMRLPTSNAAYLLQFGQEQPGDATRLAQLGRAPAPNLQNGQQRPDEATISIVLPGGEILANEKVPIQQRRDGNPHLNRPFNQQEGLAGKRLYLFEKYDLLVLIPEGEDRLILRKLALREAIDRLAHPVVVSPTALFASSGQNFSHQVRILPKSDGVSFELVKNSTTMEVSRDGKLSWAVPARYAGKDIPVILRICDSSGKEVLHPLSILVH